MGAGASERGLTPNTWQEDLLRRALDADRSGQRLQVLMPRRTPNIHDEIARMVAAYVEAAMSERRRVEEALLSEALTHCDTLRSIERLHLVDQDGCAPAVASSWWPTE